MKLKSVEIFNFKSIKHEKFEINNNQICFVGKNESGKSSIISAISYLNILDKELSFNLLNKSSDDYPNGLPIIVGIFHINKNLYPKLYELLSEYLDTQYIVALDKNCENCLLQIKRWGNGLSNISLSLYSKDSFGLKIPDEMKNKSKFYDLFFNDIYPAIEYFENEDLLIEPSTVEELNGDDKKFETFRKLLIVGGCNDFNIFKNNDINFVTTYLSDIEIKLNQIFKKHYKQDQSINIKIVPALGDRLNLIIRDNSNKSYSINERSPGFQYYFSFLVNKLYSQKISGKKNTIIILDEPGQSLHPKGSKDLLKSFEEISETSQIFYTTHNPFLALRNCVDSLVFVEKTPDEGTKIRKKSYLNKYQILRNELGIMLNDSFLIGDINLIVEGNTEKLALHRIFQFEKYRELEWMNIYNADGVSNIPQAINYLGKNNLNLSGIILLDSDTEANNIKLKKFYKNNISQANWEEIEINSVYNDKEERTFEDLFPQDIYISALNNYCKSLENLDIFDKPYSDLVYTEKLKTPIVNIANEHFKKFISAKSTSNITKQDVIRHLLDLIDQQDDKVQQKNLVDVFKLFDKIKTSFLKIERYVSN
ncbi:AAA family ATPase [Epilithonimonas sp. JDS]|uniref:ATP-dependent nuclease n=1 Tax=Epilithonimonas sp. JDS TaxID=2902797 RepID=UPI001E55FC61|nr:AAA family ATPase [Epilithonimonas sp. JDS]MCD9854717.1 AAA family ATPase [Epilithonimonas sp. JDS]